MSNNTVVPLFKNRTLGSVVLEDGTLVAFANKQFYTQDTDLIARLKRAADKGEFGIFIDPAEPDVDLEAATPMERLRKKHREELMAELAAGKAPVVAATSAPKVSTVASVGSTVSLTPTQQNPELNKALAEGEQQAQTEPAPEVTETAPVSGAAQLSTLEKLKAAATKQSS